MHSTRPQPPASRTHARRRAVAGAVLLAALALAAFLVLRDDGPLPRDGVAVVDPDAGFPFAYSDDRREELEERAAAGLSHVLYEKSPGGIVASAKRTARFRDQIESAAEGVGADPDLMEAMVLLESAGRPDAVAGEDPEAAAGLAQILAETGTSLLGMEIDLGRSRELTSEIAAAEGKATGLAARAAREKQPRKASKLERRAERAERRARTARRERARVDARFDPPRALAGMARYLQIGAERFGRDDLAVVSYHMGIGNLETALERYVGPRRSSGSPRDLVERNELNYARLYFDSSPTDNRRAWDFLSGLGDDSSSYYWRVLAARGIMDLYRSDRDRLVELARLHDAKSTAEEVFHPASETKVFADADEIDEATAAGEVVPIPEGRRYGFEVGDQLGELAKSLDRDRDTYRALRPEALATLIYITARVRAITGERGRLKLTSAIRDREYQASLVGRNAEATTNYSLHTTGNSFDILRRYRNKRQGEAFQFVLDRMKAHGVIDYAVEPAAIHVTVSERADRLLEG